MKKILHIVKKGLMCACALVIVVSATTASASAATSGYGGGPDCSLKVVPPSRGFSFRINNGDSVVYNRKVDLTMRGGSAAYMEISNNSWFIGSSVMPYATNTHWWLDYWPGYKTVYVRFSNKCQQMKTPTISKTVYSYAWW